MKQFNWTTLSLFLLLTFTTGTISSLLTGDTIMKYSNMYQPYLSPPGWIFPIVWFLLFVLISLSTCIVFNTAPKPISNKLLLLYLVQLFFVFIWPILFFKYNLYLIAFAFLIILWVTIFLMISKFHPISTLASKLLYPYLLWVTFAGYLNLSIILYYR